MLLGESSSSDDDVARAASAHAAAHPQPKRPCHEADRVRACAEARFDVEHELNDQVLRAACATPANAPKRSAPVQQAQLRVQLDESSDEDCPISRAANAHANKPSSAAGSTKTESAVAVARLGAEREAGIVRDRERREEAVDRAAHVHENANLREWISHMREEISESCERFEASGNEAGMRLTWPALLTRSMSLQRTMASTPGCALRISSRSCLGSQQRGKDCALPI